MFVISGSVVNPKSSFFPRAETSAFVIRKCASDPSPRPSAVCTRVSMIHSMVYITRILRFDIPILRSMDIVFSLSAKMFFSVAITDSTAISADNPVKISSLRVVGEMFMF